MRSGQHTQQLGKGKGMSTMSGMQLILNRYFLKKNKTQEKQSLTLKITISLCDKNEQSIN